MHVGRGGKASKTECVFFPSARDTRIADPANTADIEVDGGGVSFTDHFKYLGSIIASDLSDSTEMDALISAAAKVFGALRPSFFSQKGVEPRAKKAAYEAVVLNLLLYGCETWAITQHMQKRLQSFHHRCL